MTKTPAVNPHANRKLTAPQLRILQAAMTGSVMKGYHAATRTWLYRQGFLMWDDEQKEMILSAAGRAALGTPTADDWLTHDFGGTPTPLAQSDIDDDDGRREEPQPAAALAGGQPTALRAGDSASVVDEADREERREVAAAYLNRLMVALQAIDSSLIVMYPDFIYSDLIALSYIEEVEPLHYKVTTEGKRVLRRVDSENGGE